MKKILAILCGGVLVLVPVLVQAQTVDPKDERIALLEMIDTGLINLVRSLQAQLATRQDTTIVGSASTDQSAIIAQLTNERDDYAQKYAAAEAFSAEVHQIRTDNNNLKSLTALCLRDPSTLSAAARQVCVEEHISR